MITRIVAVILLLCQLAVWNMCFPEAAQAPQQGSALSLEAETEAQTGQSAVRVALPPSQQVLGELIQTVAAEQGIAVELDILTGEGGYLGALMSGYAESPRDIYWVSGEADAQDLFNNGIKPANMRNTEAGLPIYTLSRLTPIETRILDPRHVYGLPVGLTAEGTLVNIEQIASLLGSKDLAAVQRDLVFCTYEEWTALCDAIAAYLERPSNTDVTLSGRRYTMPRYRPENAMLQRGLYAVATGQPASLLENTLTAAFATAYQDPATLVYTTPEEIAAVMEQPLHAVFGRLEQDTRIMTQDETALARGEGYAEIAKISGEAAEKLFTNGTALFIKGNTQTGIRLEAQNPQLEGNLVLIPNKLPLENENVAVINEMFGLSASGHLCVWEQSANKSAAYDLLVALFTTDTGKKGIEQELNFACFSDPYPRDGLQRQVMDALTFGNVYPLPATADSLSAVMTLIGEWTNNELMSLEEWGEEQENSFVSMAQGAISSLGLVRAA